MPELGVTDEDAIAIEACLSFVHPCQSTLFATQPSGEIVITRMLKNLAEIDEGAVPGKY